MPTPLRIEYEHDLSLYEGASPSHAAPAVVRHPKPVLMMKPAAHVRRRIPPVSGRALEILGHAIEYLADEYVLESGRLPSIHAHDPQVEAMQILMAANRSVYFECPVIPPLHVRFRSWLHSLRPQHA